MRSLYLLILLLVSILFTESCSHKNDNQVQFNGDLFDAKHIHEIRLSFTDAQFWDTLVKNKKLRDSLEISNYTRCNVSIDGHDIKDVGVRLKGESSYDFTKGKKKSFKIDLNQFIRKQRYSGVSKLNLNNNYKDPSMLREKLTLDLMQQMGTPTPRNAFAAVYLNDEYWGLYLMEEDINKVFLRKNFGNKNGNFYFCEPNGNLVQHDKMDEYYHSYKKKNNKSANDWNDLTNFIKVANSIAKEEKYEKDLDTIFATDNCLKAWAVNNLLVNVDAYNMLYPHNYFLYHDSATNKLNWINYDYNFSFAAWTPKYNLQQVCDFDILFYDKKFPFAVKVLGQNPLLKQRYLAIMKDLTENYFTKDKFTQLVDSYYSLIKDDVFRDTKKEYSNDDFEKNISTTIGDKGDPGAFTPGLKEFMECRRASVLGQLQKHQQIN